MLPPPPPPPPAKLGPPLPLDRNRFPGRADSTSCGKSPASVPPKPNHASFGLYLAVGLALVLGGSARADVDSLIVLHPAAVLLLGAAVSRIGLVRWNLYRPHIVFGATIVGFVAAQIIPLPPAIWTQLPGRQVIAKIDAASEIGQIWRPFTMTPLATWNSLCFLTLPIATLLLGAIAPFRRRKHLLELWLILGALSALLGIIQIVAPAAEAYLYPYDVTNLGAGVGLFANRNHQAVFLVCMIPMLAAYASRREGAPQIHKIRRYISLAAIIFLFVTLLATGSRSGLLLSIFAMASVPFIYCPPTHYRYGNSILRRSQPWRVWTISLIGAGLTIVAITMNLVRVESLTRLTDANLSDERRWQMLSLTVTAAKTYLPWGAGTGGFAQVIQLHEPSNLLSPQYFNQAHNDVADLLLTAGIPGAVLLLIAMVGYARAFAQATRFNKREMFSPNQRLYRAGITIVTIIGLASLTDYPLRTPAIACLFVTALLWLPRQVQKVRKFTQAPAAWEADQ